MPADEGGGERPEGATPKGTIVVLNRDLFFGVRIANTLRAIGWEVTIAPTTEAFVARLRPEGQPPALGVIDIAAGVDWELLRTVTDDPAVGTPLLAFGPHLDVEGLRAAKAAGVRRVVSNGEFHRGMVELVRRYAVVPRPQPLTPTGDLP